MGDQPSAREADAGLLAADVPKTGGEKRIVLDFETVLHDPSFAEERFSNESRDSPNHQVVGEKELVPVLYPLDAERVDTLVVGGRRRDQRSGHAG